MRWACAQTVSLPLSLPLSPSLSLSIFLSLSARARDARRGGAVHVQGAQCVRVGGGARARLARRARCALFMGRGGGGSAGAPGKRRWPRARHEPGARIPPSRSGTPLPIRGTSILACQSITSYERVSERGKGRARERERERERGRQQIVRNQY
jgi:hypothetical protein